VIRVLEGLADAAFPAARAGLRADVAVLVGQEGGVAALASGSTSTTLLFSGFHRQPRRG
jgi:hypothetical protein